jgi:hypothetical protein
LILSEQQIINLKKFFYILLSVLCLNANATNYYFSTTDGDDARTSVQAQSSATPWKTIAKLNTFFSSLAAGDVIYFKRGDIFPGGIVPTVSGSAGNPITFDAYSSGAKPIITGFAAVSGFTNISGSLWVSNSAASTLTTLNIVTIGGNFVPIGRTPNSGYFNVDSHVNGTSLTSSSLTGTPNWTGGQVVVRKNHWILDKSAITSQTTSTINFTNPTAYDCQNNFGFFIQNDSLACDVQNEYWYNPSKKIGIYSVGSPSNVQVATIDILVDVSAKIYLTFSNLQFTGSNSAVFNITTGNHIDVEACDFLNNGMNGFTVLSSAHDITLNNCTADRTMNDFISGGGSTAWLITNNIITNTAEVAGMGNSSDGMYIAMYNMGDNSLIQYNSVTNTGYNGIDFRGNSISVLNNYVNVFCNVKDDGAGIYTFTGATPTAWTQRYVRKNIVLYGGGASAGTLTSHEDAYGIYMDGNSSQVTIDSNTVAHMGSAGVFLNGTHNIDIRDNNFFDCMLTIPSTFGELYIKEFSPYQVTRGLDVRRNVFMSVQNNQHVATFSTDVNDLNLFGTFDSNFYCRPFSETNDFFLQKTSGNSTTNLAGWKSFSSLDANSVTSPKTVTSTDSLRIEYNASNVSASVSLGAKYQDVYGNIYNGNITIPAYGSAILIYIGVAANNRKGLFFMRK